MSGGGCEDSSKPTDKPFKRVLYAALNNPGSPKPGHGKLFGAKTVTWIRQHLDHTVIELYVTRNFVPKEIALYLEWLKFADDALANEFVTTWPRYHIPNAIEQLNKKR
jgi:hypothetical protein